MKTRATLHTVPTVPPVAAPLESQGGGWRAYLVVAVALTPLCVPGGPGQTALVDAVNMAALLVFAFAVLLPGAPLRVPFAGPVLLVAFGSLLAMTNAESMSQALLAVAQDVYLFAWLVMVAYLMRSTADLRAMRLAWVISACVVAMVAVAQLLLHTGGSVTGLFGSRGLRPSGTLYNPNMLADYLVGSLFVGLSLARELPRLLRWGMYVVLGLGLVVTKSNGGMVSLAAGFVVWTLVRAVTTRTPFARIAAAMGLLAGIVLLGGWLHLEWGVGRELATTLRQHTFAGRMEHSSESRLRIWDTLERTYARSPLGIGPGNSGAQTLSIGERERPGSLQSKEAHSDYLAFAVERGPLGLVGLLLVTALAFATVGSYWRHARRLRGHTRGASAWTAAMAAALAASAVHSAVIEKLHFRHFWLLLAMVCGSALLAERQAAAAAARRTAHSARRVPALTGPRVVTVPARGALVGAGMRVGA
jgi:hypothetical protein